MKLLVRDFLRRWWWVVAIIALIAAGTTFADIAVVLAPAGSLLVVFDAQRGAIRATRGLPISSREQSLAWWVAGVLAVPVICAVLMLPAAVLRGVIFPHSNPWFGAGVQLYIGLGYSALCFLIGIVVPSRPAERWPEHILQGIVGGLWGLAVPGATFLLPNLPRTPAQVQPWHWLLFGLVPVLVPLSYFGAGEMLRRRSVPILVKSDAPDRNDRRAANGMVGVPLFLATVPARLALMLVAMAAIQVTVVGLMMHRSGGQPWPMVGGQMAMFGCLIGAFTSEWIGLRALRVLPISTGQLTAILLASPITAGLVTALLNLSWTAFGSQGVHPLGMGLGVAGFGALMLAINLHLPGAGKFAVMFVAAMIVPLTGFLLPKAASWVAVVGMAAGVAGAVVIYRGLRRSRAFYETRRMMGMTLGQAQ